MHWVSLCEHHHSTLGRMTMKSTHRALGHLLVRSRARTAHSFAYSALLASLTCSWAVGWWNSILSHFQSVLNHCGKESLERNLLLAQKWGRSGGKVGGKGKNLFSSLFFHFSQRSLLILALVLRTLKAALRRSGAQALRPSGSSAQAHFHLLISGWEKWWLMRGRSKVTAWSKELLSWSHGHSMDSGLRGIYGVNC